MAKNDETPAFYDGPGINVETYDARAALETLVVRGDVDFFLEEAGKRNGPVLDLGAGTGRVAWPLAEAGFKTVGLEFSGPMVERARAKAERASKRARERIRFVQGDMRDFDLGTSFALAVIPFRSFQCLLTPADQQAALDCIRRHLESGGELVIDLFDPRYDWCHPGGLCEGEPFEIPLAGSENRLRVRMGNRTTDPLAQTLSEHWTFSEIDPKGGVAREETEILRLRWTHRQEARYLFERQGYRIEAEYSDFRRSPPAYAAEQVWVLRKE
jgi:SAM-dependent methyltransferase